MPAPKKNRFWELRSTHGRKRLFESPKLLWEAACEYFQWCEDNPFKEVDFRGGMAKRVTLSKMRPFTMQGLCLYLDCNTGYFRDFKDSLKKRADEEAKDFSCVITRVEEIVYNQKFSGAAAGFFNANIISRDLGLAERSDNKNDTKLEIEVSYDDTPTAADGGGGFDED